MEITETHLSGRGYDIRLPIFSQELPDRFYARMAEEMIGYVSADSTVRRYTASFSADENEGIISVTVELRARIIRPGGTTVKKKLLCQTWKDGALVSFTADKAV